MPNVGGVEFPYTPEGVAAAQDYQRALELQLLAEQTGGITSAPASQRRPGRPLVGGRVRLDVPESQQVDLARLALEAAQAGTLGGSLKDMRAGLPTSRRDAPSVGPYSATGGVGPDADTLPVARRRAVPVRSVRQALGPDGTREISKLTLGDIDKRRLVEDMLPNAQRLERLDPDWATRTIREGDLQSFYPAGERSGSRLGRGLKAAVSPASIVIDSALGGITGAGSAVAGHRSAAPTSAGLLSDPGPAYRGSSSTGAMNRTSDAIEEAKSNLRRQRLMEVFDLPGRGFGSVPRDTRLSALNKIISDAPPCF